MNLRKDHYHTFFVSCHACFTGLIEHNRRFSEVLVLHEYDGVSFACREFFFLITFELSNLCQPWSIFFVHVSPVCMNVKEDLHRFNSERNVIMTKHFQQWMSWLPYR